MRALVFLVVMLMTPTLWSSEIDSVRVDHGRIYVGSRQCGKLRANGTVFIRGRRVGKFHGKSFRLPDGRILAVIRGNKVHVKGVIYSLDGTSVRVSGRVVAKIGRRTCMQSLVVALLVNAGYL